ncbi:MAG: hypothetical protein Q9205_007044 [Flavoplaca limonia]
MVADTLFIPCLFVLCVVIKAVFWSGFVLSQDAPLCKIPGPVWAVFSRIWLSKVLASGDSAEQLLEVNQQYGKTKGPIFRQQSLTVIEGPLARIGPKHLITSDPAITYRIMSTASRYKRAEWFDALRIDPHVKNIVSETDLTEHNRLRYIMSAGYAGKDDQGMQAAVDDILVTWIRRLRKQWASESGQARDFDIGQRIQFLAVDITTKLCLGESFRCIEEDRDQHAFLDTVKTATPVSLQMSLFPELTRALYHLTKLASIRRLLVPSAEDKSGIGTVMRVCLTVEAVSSAID